MSSYSFDIIECDSVEAIQSQWDDLAAAAVIGNPFFESWMLLPALRLLPESKGVLLFTAYVEGSNEFIGLFPFKHSSGYKGTTARYTEIWRYSHCYFGAPLVRKGHEEGFWRTVGEWLDQDSSGPRFLSLPEFPCETTLEATLSAAAESEGRFLFREQTYDRASLEFGVDANSYRGAVLGKRAKQFRQKEKKLGKEGSVKIQYITEEKELGAWLDRFLRLEKESWKGRQGTAMASTEQDEEFFRQVITSAIRSNRLQMAVLLSGSQIAAIRTGFVSGPYEYSFKITYNEGLSKYSPGVLLELAHAENFLKRKEMVLLDSCATPDQRMLNQVLMNRRTIGVYELSSSAFTSKLFLKAMGVLTRLKRLLRRPKTPSAVQEEQ